MTVIDVYEPSRALAREVRAECARQGLSTRALADRMGTPHTWLARRISPRATVDLTMEDMWLMADALGVSPAKLQQDAGLLVPIITMDDVPPDDGGASAIAEYLYAVAA